MWRGASPKPRQHCQPTLQQAISSPSASSRAATASVQPHPQTTAASVATDAPFFLHTRFDTPECAIKEDNGKLGATLPSHITTVSFRASGHQKKSNISPPPFLGWCIRPTCRFALRCLLDTFLCCSTLAAWRAEIHSNQKTSSRAQHISTRCNQLRVPLSLPKRLQQSAAHHQRLELSQVRIPSEGHTHTCIACVVVTSASMRSVRTTSTSSRLKASTSNLTSWLWGTSSPGQVSYLPPHISQDARAECCDARLQLPGDFEIAVPCHCLPPPGRRA
jgi:hypothetical protein